MCVTRGVELSFDKKYRVHNILHTMKKKKEKEEENNIYEKMTRKKGNKTANNTLSLNLYRKQTR